MKYLFVTGSRRAKHLPPATVARAVSWADVVVHGSAPGADRLMARAARDGGKLTMPVPAVWENGPAAGPARNAALVRVAACLRALGHRVRWLAFPGPESRGTVDCIRRAEAAGFVVRVVPVGE